MAPKATAKEAAAKEEPKAKKKEHDPTQYIVPETQMWLRPLPPNFARDTLLYKEISRIITLICKRMADRKYQHPAEPKAAPQGGTKKKVKRRRLVLTIQETTLELDAFFMKWRQTLTALKRNTQELLKVEEHVRRSGKVLTPYQAEERVKSGNCASVAAMANIEIIEKSMQTLGMLPIESDYRSAALASPSPDADLPASPDPPARALNAEIREHQAPERDEVDMFGNGYERRAPERDEVDMFGNGYERRAPERDEVDMFGNGYEHQAPEPPTSLDEIWAWKRGLGENGREDEKVESVAV